MDIQELQPIIDLMTNQEERLVRKINDVHEDVKRINSKVAEHEKYINGSKAVWKFIIGGIGLVATIIGICFLIFEK